MSNVNQKVGSKVILRKKEQVLEYLKQLKLEESPLSKTMMLYVITFLPSNISLEN